MILMEYTSYRFYANIAILGEEGMVFYFLRGVRCEELRFTNLVSK